MVKNNEIFQNEIDNALLNFKKANYNEAINDLEKLKKKQSHFIVYWYLGHSYFRIYDYLSAASCIKKSIELKEPDALNLSFLAEIYLEANNYDESIRLFKEVLKIESTNINSLFKLGKAYLELGEIDIAEKYFMDVIKNEPINFEAYYELIKINKKYLTTDLIKKVEKSEKSEDPNNFYNIFSKYILAENFKNTKNYKSEIKYLLDAHSTYLNKKDKAVKQELNYFNNLLPKFISKVKGTRIDLKCDLKPIFIMGLPRSGTTMIENIICSSDNNILAGGETGVFSKVFFSKKIISDYDSNELKLNFNFKKDDFKALKETILNQYNQLNINTKNNFFVDKSLENLLYLDLIAKIFPNAKFIYCKRNKYANLIGILKVFLPNIFWSHSVKQIIKMMNLYTSKVKEIISENKIKIKLIELENFSQNPAEASKDLFNFLGINWDDNVLENSYKKKNIIKTVSNLQVRKKIFKHDLGYLDNYLPYLKNYEIEKLI